MQKQRKLPLIVAHRGASALAPENTLAAFRRAINDGAEGIEFDVRLAKDGVPVVFHDSTIDRTGRMEGLVSRFTSQHLAKLDIGTWFNQKNPDKADPKFSAETVPTLAQTLDFLKDFRGLIYIELKCRESEVGQLVRAVCSELGKSALTPQVIVKSFKLAVIPQMRSLCPSVKTAALFAPKIMRFLRKEKYLVNIADELGADSLSLHFSLATRKLMKKVGKKRMPVAIWTADHPRWVKRAFQLGLDAIITNDPGRLLKERHSLLSA